MSSFASTERKQTELTIIPIQELKSPLAFLGPLEKCSRLLDCRVILLLRVSEVRWLLHRWEHQSIGSSPKFHFHIVVTPGNHFDIDKHSLSEGSKWIAIVNVVMELSDAGIKRKDDECVRNADVLLILAHKWTIVDIKVEAKTIIEMLLWISVTS